MATTSKVAATTKGGISPPRPTVTPGKVVPTSTKTSELTLLVANTGDLVHLDRLLKKFPTTEMESRMIKDSDWKDSLFIMRDESGEKLITFPRNVESFADNLFMISLVRLCVLMQWKIQLSTRDMDTSVFESPENGFFAGFIAGACMKQTGERVIGNTRFSKGIAAFQSYSVEKEFGKLPHLRTGGMDSLLQRLSQMKGFTKDYWGIRGSLAAIFKLIRPIPVTELKSFLLPMQEIKKNIRTKLPYENGGLFRTEEIAYLGERYLKQKTRLQEFLAKLENPTEDFARSFIAEYTPIKTGLERIDTEIRLIAVNRSKVLFPAGNKKSILNFKKKTLDEKLEEVLENHESLFAPESLPGISKDGDSQKKEMSTEWREDVYSSYSTEPAAEVIDSWYTLIYSMQE